MKKLEAISLAILLSLGCVGCGGGDSADVEVKPTPAPVENLEKQEEVIKFEEEDFENFFKTYFSYTDDEIMILNRRYDKESEIYWDNLKNNYSKLIKNKLGSYLSKELLDKMDKGYTHEEIMMPKFALLNNYMVSGNGDVEKIEIRSTRPLGENTVYEVAVTTSNKCYPVGEFITKHSMGAAENYFIRRAEGAEAVSFAGVDVAEIEKHKYLYSNSSLTDKMKLEHKLWITVKDSEDLEIEEIKASENWQGMSEEQNSPTSTQHITRVPYDTEVNKENEELLKDFFMELFESGKNEFQTMEVAFDTNGAAYQKWIESIGFKDKFIIDEATYKDAFSKEITPYKDEIVGITTDKNSITIEQSVYSTENQPRYIVTVKAETLQKNNQVVYYNYKYYVGMEDDKIEQMSFMGIKSGDVEKDEVTKVEDTQPNEQPDEQSSEEPSEE